MRALLVGDIHLSDRPPSSCTDTYLDDLLDLLEQTVVLASSCDVVVWAGDVFHHKAPSRTSHRTVQRVIRLIENYPVPVYICPGNHDMSNDRFESLRETQPLGVLLEAGARLLNGWDDEFPLYGVPWLQDFTDEAVADALAEWREEPVPEDGFGAHRLVVAHAPLFPPGEESPWESYPTEAWAHAMGGEGNCYYGHVHEHHGTYHVAGVQFCNAGAITRGSLHENELTRAIKVTVWDSEAGDFTEYTLDYKPASEVFRLVEAGEVKDTKGRLDAFLDSVGSASLEVVSTESVLTHVRGLDVEPAVYETIRELLESV